jgi:hypothetical protein
MGEQEDYACPFCGKLTTVTDERRSRAGHPLQVVTAEGFYIIVTTFRVCPNPKCRHFSLLADLFKAEWKQGALSPTEPVKNWALVPPSAAKTFPDYVPAVIRLDYEEACSIVSSSPKASATLSRRCLQGMIRDYWGIQKATLSAEIGELEPKIDPLTWKAIDSVRKIGNIGAHMEKDVNVIIDVEPDEAAKLIWLIELLMSEWYIHRHERGEKLRELTELAAAKDAAKKPAVPKGN